VSFSFRLGEKGDLADEISLVRNFVAYLKLVLDKESFRTYISSEMSREYGVVAQLSTVRSYGVTWVAILQDIVPLLTIEPSSSVIENITRARELAP